MFLILKLLKSHLILREKSIQIFQMLKLKKHYLKKLKVGFN